MSLLKSKPPVSVLPPSRDQLVVRVNDLRFQRNCAVALAAVMFAWAMFNLLLFRRLLEVVAERGQ